MFNNDDVCDLVQIDLARVRKIRAALVAAGRRPGPGRYLQRARRSDPRAHPRCAVARRAVCLRSGRGVAAEPVGGVASAAPAARPAAGPPAPRRPRRVLLPRRSAHHFALQADAAARRRTSRAGRQAAPRDRRLRDDQPSRRAPAGDCQQPITSAARTAKSKRRRRPARAIRGWFTAAAAVLVAAACGVGWFTAFPDWSAPIFIAATLIGSVFPAQRAWQSITRGSLDINVLMVVAVVGALAIRQFEEAAMVVSLFAAAQWLEAQSLDRARQAIGRLLDLAPTDGARPRCERRARRRHRAGDPGALMIVRPGEKIRARRHRPQRPFRRQPGADHRRIAAGRKGRGRRGVCRARSTAMAR